MPIYRLYYGFYGFPFGSFANNEGKPPDVIDKVLLAALSSIVGGVLFKN